MEKPIFEQACARLNSAEAVAYIAAAGVLPIKTLDWYQDQIEDALDEENQSLVFDTPALFFEFSPTKYEATAAKYQDANGELILHVVQDKIGKDARDGAETQPEFKKLLDLLPLLVDVLTDGKLPCTALLVRTNTERDHKNTPILHEKITFSWTGREKRTSIPPI